MPVKGSGGWWLLPTDTKESKENQPGEHRVRKKHIERIVISLPDETNTQRWGPSDSSIKRKGEHSVLNIFEASDLFIQVVQYYWHGTSSGIGLLDSKGFFPAVVFILLKEDRAIKHVFSPKRINCLWRVTLVARCITGDFHLLKHTSHSQWHKMWFSSQQSDLFINLLSVATH